MEFNFYAEGIDLPDLNYNKIKSWVNKVINNYNYKSGNISFIFTSVEYIHETNIKYLNHNYQTDIITFDYSKKNIISGDLFICPDVIKQNALDFNTTFEKEIHRVIIHGILHLIGFDDLNEIDQKQIRIEEDKSLSIIGL